MELLYLLDLRLRFLSETHFHFFHHAAFHAAIRDRLGNPDTLPHGIAFYTPERGKVIYRKNTPYHLGVALKVNGEISPEYFLSLVDSPPKTKFGQTSGAPFGNNYSVISVIDAVEKLPLGETAHALKLADLEETASHLAKQKTITIRMLSPMFIRYNSKRGRTLMDGEEFFADKFLATLLRLLSNWWPKADFLKNLKVPENVVVVENRLLRTDVRYAKKDKYGQAKVLLGTSGSITFNFPNGVGNWAIPLLLGGIIGVSRPTNRRMGQGRYEILDHSLPCLWPPTPAQNILQRASHPDNMAIARDEISKAGPAHGVDGINKNEFLDTLTVHLPKLSDKLRNAKIKAKPLRGILIREENKEYDIEKIRPLAIPTLEDRFLQRAILQEMEPALDQLFEDTSFAYRKGLSAKTAERAVNQARKEGYIYTLDADIRAFFDEVDWDKLQIRLEAYFHDDPVIQVLMDWIKAPVDFSDTLFTRTAGLPQGAVISPILANLYLDAFDEAIQRTGFKLIRYADDFVILAKNKSDIKKASEITREELEKLDLVLHDKKTKITSFDSGFSFLGSLFCRSLILKTDKKNGRITQVINKASPTYFDSIIQNPSGWLSDFLNTAQNRSSKPYTASPQTSNIRWKPAVFPPNPHRRPVYVITGQAKLSGRKQGLLIEKEGEKNRMIPWNELSEIVILSGRFVSGSVIQRAMKHRIPIAFHKWDGTPLGLVLPDRVRTPSPLAMMQWEWMSSNDRSLDPARKLIAAKIRNTRMFIRRRREDVSKLMAQMKTAINSTEKADSVEPLRGIEGNIAHAYFSQWPIWLGGKLDTFPGRITRKAEDPVNVMLNLLYTQLFRLTHTTILSTGLDPYLGILHEGRGRYAALAADLMEPFRFLVDRLVLNAVNHNFVKPQDFLYSEKGPYKLRVGKLAMKKLISDFEMLMSSEIANRYDIKDTYRGHLYRQAMSLTRVIEGKDNLFQPFEMKW